MAALDPGVIESVINANFKAIAEAELISSQDHKNRMRVLSETAMGNILNGMNTANVNVSEAQGLKTVQESGLASQIQALTSSLAAALAQLQAGGGSTKPA